jgi:hypothetical protein
MPHPPVEALKRAMARWGRAASIRGGRGAVPRADRLRVYQGPGGEPLETHTTAWLQRLRDNDARRVLRARFKLRFGHEPDPGASITWLQKMLDDLE